jgi:4-hydroxy-2-oxoheptanedioate aldolase
VPANDRAGILRHLDTGAMGVHVPLVASAAEAEAAVQAVKYSPRGDRGLAGVRATDYGQKGSLAAYVKEANVETLVVIQIETVAAVERAGEIAAVDGVDVVFIGPTDLSQALGVPGELSHPRLEESYAAVARAAHDAGKALGVLTGDESGVLAWRERGARYIAVTSDSLVTRSAKMLLRAVK